MKPLATILALAVVAVILLRHREPVAAAPLRPLRVPLGSPSSANPASAYGVLYADLQPSDPYPASVLR